MQNILVIKDTNSANISLKQVHSYLSLDINKVILIAIKTYKIRINFNVFE